MSSRALLCGLALLLGGCSGSLTPKPPPFTPKPAPQVSLSSLEQALLTEINAARALGRTACSTNLGAGRFEDRTYPPAGPLVFNPYLTAVAQAHARDMAQNRFLSHDGSSGSSTASRIVDIGWAETWQVEENLAVLLRDAGAAATVRAWLESRLGHCGALMNAAYTQVGLGEVAGQFESLGVASVGSSGAGSSGLGAQALLEVRFWAAEFGVAR